MLPTSWSLGISLLDTPSFMTLCVIIALESRVGQELGSKICILSGTQMQFPVVVIARHDIIILHLLSEVCPVQSSRAYYLLVDRYSFPRTVSDVPQTLSFVNIKFHWTTIETGYLINIFICPTNPFLSI